MKTPDFKKALKEVKETLRGQSVRIVLAGVAERFTTLRELGNKILELEAKGYSFSFYEGDYTTIVVDSGVDMEKLIKSFGTSA